MRLVIQADSSIAHALPPLLDSTHQYPQSVKKAHGSAGSSPESNQPRQWMPRCWVGRGGPFERVGCYVRRRPVVCMMAMLKQPGGRLQLVWARVEYQICNGGHLRGQARVDFERASRDLLWTLDRGNGCA